MLDTHVSTPATPALPPPGFVRRLSITQFTMYLAVMGPTLGGLSAKVQHLVGSDAAASKLGLVTGVGAVFAMVSQPLAGRLSDRSTSRFGMRRPFLVGGIIATALALLACALAPNVTVLLVAWCVTQVAVNFAFAAGGATVADQVPENRRGSVSGIIGAVTPLSMLVGAGLLAVLPSDLLRFTVPALVAIPVVIWFAARLSDRVRTDAPTEPLGLRNLLLSFVFDPRKHPDLGWAWLSKFLIMLGYCALSTYLTLFLADRFGMTDTDDQLRFNAVANLIGVGTLVVFSLVGGVLSDRVGRRKPFIVAGGLVMAAAFLGIAAAPSLGHDAGLAALLILEVPLGMGVGVFFAVDNALCLQLLPDPEDTAKDLGVLNIANTLPQSVAPFLGGVCAIPLGNLLLDNGGYTLWFCLAAVFCATGGLLVTRIKGVK